MQVATPTAASVTRASYASLQISFQQVQSQSSISPHQQMSAMARWALNYLAGSSRLKDSEIRGLINLIATIDQFAGGDPKLIVDVIAIAKMMEAPRPEGSYRTHSFKELEDMYWDARKNMGGGNDSIESITANITELKLQYQQADIKVDAIPSISNAAPDVLTDSTNLIA